MKKVFLAFFAISIAGLVFAASPKDFKGVISYKISYEGADLNEQMLSFLPKTMMSYFKDEMSRSDLIMGMGKTIKIKNGEEKSVITLLDMMGQKVGYKMSYEELMEEMEDGSETEVEIRDETKEIMGYACRRAVIKIKSPEGETTRMNAWFTDELGTNTNHFDTPEFKDIEGILLEFEMQAPQFTMVFTAVSIDKKKVPSSEFEIPEGFEIKTKEEVEGMFGGM